MVHTRRVYALHLEFQSVEVHGRDAVEHRSKARIVAVVIVPEEVSAELRREIQLLIAIQIPNARSEAADEVNLLGLPRPAEAVVPPGMTFSRSLYFLDWTVSYFTPGPFASDQEKLQRVVARSL